MNIEIKNFKYSKFASHETICFSADFYIQGLKVFHAENDGNGGNTNIHILNKNLYSEYKKFVSSLPKQHDKVLNFSYSYDEESYVDELISKLLDRKELENNMKKYLLIADSLDADSYTTLDYRSGNKVIPIEKVLEINPALIQKSVDKFKAQGKVILNTNLKGIKL